MVIPSCSYVNHQRAIEFYDQQVKNFPEVQNISSPKVLKEGEQLPFYKNDKNELLSKIVKVIIALVFYCFPAFVAGEAARKRGYENTWYLFTLFSLMFTPVLGFLAVIAFPVKVNYIKVIK
jgi:hypothetical protein